MPCPCMLAVGSNLGNVDLCKGKFGEILCADHKKSYNMPKDWRAILSPECPFTMFGREWKGISHMLRVLYIGKTRNIEVSKAYDIESEEGIDYSMVVKDNECKNMVRQVTAMVLYHRAEVEPRFKKALLATNGAQLSYIVDSTKPDMLMGN